jgi:hypothetical protein
MTMLAETVDAVIGTGTHRDTHEVEIADPAGKPIAGCGSTATVPGSPGARPRSAS